MHLRLVFEKLQGAGIRLNVAKCEFGVERMDFLGYTISKEGIIPTEEKVIAISQFTKPKN